jgi:hypothetical protein
MSTSDENLANENKNELNIILVYENLELPWQIFPDYVYKEILDGT